MLTIAKTFTNNRIENKMPPRKILYFLPFIALLLLGGMMGTRLLAAKDEPKNATVIRALKPAPSLTGVMYPENNPPFTDAHFKGQYTVVYFFSSMCAPCL
jgi:hypothetical protein